MTTAHSDLHISDDSSCSYIYSNTNNDKNYGCNNDGNKMLFVSFLNR